MPTRSILLVLGCALARLSFAQSLPDQKYEPAYVMVDDHVVGELMLDTVQRRQLHEVELRYQRGYEELMQQEGIISDEELGRKVKALNDERDAGIRGALSPKQYDQWNALLRQEEAVRRTQ